MAKPIPETITDVLVSRLEAITVAGGYQFTAAGVEKIDRDKNTFDPEPLKIYVDEKGCLPNSELSYPGNPPREAWDMTFEINGYASQLDRDSSQVGLADPSVTDMQMQSAILKAIVAGNNSTWHEFGLAGTNAVNAVVVNCETFDGTEYDGAKIELVVTYRHPEGDPYPA